MYNIVEAVSQGLQGRAPMEQQDIKTISGVCIGLQGHVMFLGSNKVQQLRSPPFMASRAMTLLKNIQKCEHL